MASTSLQADVAPVVELEVDDVVLEVDQACRPREAPCAARNRVMTATVDLLRKRFVDVLRREGVGRIKCSASSVKAAEIEPKEMRDNKINNISESLNFAAPRHVT